VRVSWCFANLVGTIVGMTANETVAAVVELERRRRGLTRLQLAAMLGTNSAWVSRKLNGDRAWTLEDMDLVSERLGVPLPVLLMAPVGSGAVRPTGE
jgi:transcriptional regulator with XRE-family HTH domain